MVKKPDIGEIFLSRRNGTKNSVPEKKFCGGKNGNASAKKILGKLREKIIKRRDERTFINKRRNFSKLESSVLPICGQQRSSPKKLAYNDRQCRGKSMRSGNRGDSLPSAHRERRRRT